MTFAQPRRPAALPFGAFRPGGVSSRVPVKTDRRFAASRVKLLSPVSRGHCVRTTEAPRTSHGSALHDDGPEHDDGRAAEGGAEDPRAGRHGAQSRARREAAGGTRVVGRRRRGERRCVRSPFPPSLTEREPTTAREHRVGVRTRGGGGPRVRLLRDARTRITIDETPPLRPRRIIWPPGRGIRDRRRARPSGSRPAMPPPDGHVAARSRDTREHVMSPSIASTHSWTRTDRPHPSIRSPQIPPPRIRRTKRRRRPPSPTPRSPRPYPNPSRRRSASAGAAPRMPRLAMPRLAMPTTPRMMKTKTAKKKPRRRGRTPTPTPSPRSRCPP